MNRRQVSTSAPLVKELGLLNKLYLLCGIFLLAALFYNHFQLVRFEIPLDYNEAMVPTVTATIVNGDSPFSLESQPARTSLYPVLFNLVVAPLTLIFGIMSSTGVVLNQLSAYSVIVLPVLIILALNVLSQS
jgi:hypothetical protein